VVEADVDEVTLPGALGALGILPGHAPLLCALRIGELGYRQGSREHYLALQWGFAEVAGDGVTVLADVAELPAEIDVEAARADKLSAEEALRAASGQALEHARLARRRFRARLQPLPKPPSFCIRRRRW
jgi:F-type H+-transporting ATPase subunit epsilon